MTSITELELNVIRWAEARKIIPRSNPQAQLVKLTEELGELAGGIARNRPEQIKDGLGDMMVVMIILADLCGLSLRECLAAAYTEIRYRKGTMNHEGVFIKEADL